MKVNKFFHCFIGLLTFSFVNYECFNLVIYSARLSKKHYESNLAFLVIIVLAALIVLLWKHIFIKNKPKVFEKIIIYLALINLLYWIIALFSSYTCIVCNYGLPNIIKWAEPFVWNN